MVTLHIEIISTDSIVSIQCYNPLIFLIKYCLDLITSHHMGQEVVNKNYELSDVFPLLFVSG